MRALVFDGPWQLAVRSRPDPAPGPGQALLRILATGICGSDLHGYTGENGRRQPQQVMGHETVAEVVALGPPGENETPTMISPGLGVGSLVTVNPVLGCRDCQRCRDQEPQRCTRRRVIGVDPDISSAMAELMCAPTANLVALAEGIHPLLGALVEPLSVGWHAVGRAEITAGDRVLIVGAGPIGQATALAARRAGAGHISVVDPNPTRRRLVASLGFEAVEPAAVQQPDQEPFDVAIDAVGSTETLKTALAATGNGSRIVLVGMHAPQVALDAYAISTAERSVVGSFCYRPDEFAATAAWAATEGEALLPLIEGLVGLDEAVAAFHDLADGSWQASKVLVLPQDRRVGVARTVSDPDLVGGRR